jgi:pimeloyl-ACP methyl ester carboxylesterase
MDRQLCVRRWRGQEQGTLVALHGLLDSSEGWDALSAKLSGSIVAFDLAGFGHSDAPAQSSIAGYAQDVAAGLEMLGVERFTLVGHSLGGAVATAVAELIPDKVAALVLLAPVGFGRMHLAEAASLPVARQLLWRPTTERFPSPCEGIA